LKSRFRIQLAFSALAASIFLLSTIVAAQPARLAELLPPGAELGTWKPEGDPQVFRGDELYVYIDGGADIYLEYGFAQALVQDYQDRSGQRATLEIFEMASAESAFGIFTFKTGPGGKEIDLGDECRLADYYLNLRKGSLVITITGLDPETATEEGLLFLARAVGAKIKIGAARPPLAGRLPEEGLRPQSLRFFKGPLGLSNSDRLAAGSVFGFERGVKADYDPGYSLILLEFPDEPTAARRFAESIRLFSQVKKLVIAPNEGSRFEGSYEKGSSVSGELRGRFIVLITGASSAGQARKVIDRLARSLSDKA
jgi:hypothetical protein